MVLLGCFLFIPPVLFYVSLTGVYYATGEDRNMTSFDDLMTELRHEGWLFDKMSGEPFWCVRASVRACVLIILPAIDRSIDVFCIEMTTSNGSVETHGGHDEHSQPTTQLVLYGQVFCSRVYAVAIGNERTEQRSGFCCSRACARCVWCM